MTPSKEDLRAYLKADQAMTKQPSRLFVKWFTQSDEYYLRAFMVVIGKNHPGPCHTEIGDNCLINTGVAGVSA